MKGNFYAIEKNISDPEIESQIDETKFGVVINLVGHLKFDRIIECKKINHSSAELIDDETARYLINNFTTKDD